MFDFLPFEIVVIILTKAVMYDRASCYHLYKVSRQFQAACKKIRNATLYTHWFNTESPQKFMSQYGKISNIYFTRGRPSDQKYLKCIGPLSHVGILERSGITVNSLRKLE